MRRLSLLALASLLGGVALLAYGATVGQVQVYLVFIVPVFTGSGPIPLAGTGLIMLGFVLGFLSLAQAPRPVPESTPRDAAPPGPSTALSTPPTKRFGGVVFLGPLPIVFGSDARMSKYMLVLALAVTVLLVMSFLIVLFVRP